MAVVLSCYEFVNIAYYILLPWDKMSSTNAVAVAAFKSLLGQPGGVAVSILVAISCAGSITSNVFAVGRLTIAASQRHYLPGFLSIRGLPKITGQKLRGRQAPSNHDREPLLRAAPSGHAHRTLVPICDAPIYANILALVVTLIYILTGSFRALLTFVGMAEWVFYVSTVLGLVILRRREPDMKRPYRPMLVLPLTFVVVGSLVIVRSAMFAPVQSGALAVLLLVGAVIGMYSR